MQRVTCLDPQAKVNLETVNWGTLLTGLIFRPDPGAIIFCNFFYPLVEVYSPKLLQNLRVPDNLKYIPKSGIDIDNIAGFSYLFSA